VTRIALIFLGGGAGSVLRYALAGWTHRLVNGSFPFGTLAVNLLGCALIGLLAGLFTGPWLIREDYRIAILVGLLGGFTTFSSFAWESITLTNSGQWGLALLNVVLSNTLGLTAAWIGSRIVTVVYGP
jgi:fluoride exporter